MTQGDNTASRADGTSHTRSRGIYMSDGESAYSVPGMVMCFADMIQCTPSVQGGVVNEPGRK